MNVIVHTSDPDVVTARAIAEKLMTERLVSPNREPDFFYVATVTVIDRETGLVTSTWQEDDR